ncbi:MAG: tyrosine-type recombinase/integrase [Hyphomicrobiaceae bacterium]
MAQELNRLTAAAVRAAKGPALLADGGGLYLQVLASGAASWLFIYRRKAAGTEKSKRTEIGLGSSKAVTLAKARLTAAQCRSLLAEGRNPKDARAPNKQVPTFGEVADALIATMAPSWRNPKSRAAWEMTLRDYAKPLRNRPVNEIGVEDVLAVLKPHWERRPETAVRLRGRIERVLNYAIAKELRKDDNPAAWRGRLQDLLPPRPKLTRGHHAAMPIDDLPAFMARLRAADAVAARCLEFTILTAARTGEALGACWDEVDLEKGIWSLPAARMKAGKPHRVPLSERAKAILREMEPLKGDSGHVFPGQRRGKPLSGMALEMVLRRMKVTNATPHGMRSSFRDFVGNRTSYPRELAEHALAHRIGDAAEQAYRREDALERRRPMMEAWAQFLEHPGGDVVPFQSLAQAG